jgi:hypothetical protein
MKESKFIELLNLYVDHQISSSDAALLEAEIQRTPERRRVYRQYCQMQKACVMLSENFRTQAPADSKVVEFPAANRRFTAVTYIMGVAAAAACVALVVVNRPVRQDVPSTVVAVSGNQADAVAQTKPLAKPSVLPSVSRVALQPAFALQAREDSVVNASLVSTSRVPLDWVNRVQLQSLPSENAWLESRTTLQPEDLTFRSSRAFEGQAEMMSFRFQK